MLLRKTPTSHLPVKERQAAAPGIYTKLTGFCFQPQTSNRPAAALARVLSCEDEIKTFLYVCIKAKLRPIKTRLVASITIFHSLQVGPEYELPWASGKKPSEGWTEANVSPNSEFLGHGCFKLDSQCRFHQTLGLALQWKSYFCALSHRYLYGSIFIIPIMFCFHDALFFYLKTIIAIMIIISEKTHKKALGQAQIP